MFKGRNYFLLRETTITALAESIAGTSAVAMPVFGLGAGVVSVLSALSVLSVFDVLSVLDVLSVEELSVFELSVGVLAVLSPELPEPLEFEPPLLFVSLNFSAVRINSLKLPVKN